MMATSRLLFLSVIALAIFRCRGDCPVLAVQFGDPSALNTTTLGVYLSSEDAAFQGSKSQEGDGESRERGGGGTEGERERERERGGGGANGYMPFTWLPSSQL